MGDDLGIGPAAEDVSPGGKAVSQFLKVVDLPIQDGCDPAILGKYRLLAPLDIDDAEAAVAQEKVRTAAFMVAFFIGASVSHRSGHASYHGGVAEAYCTANSTHQDVLPGIRGSKIKR